MQSRGRISSHVSREEHGGTCRPRLDSMLFPVRALIKKEQDAASVPSERVVLGGFSMVRTFGHTFRSAIGRVVRDDVFGY